MSVWGIGRSAVTITAAARLAATPLLAASAPAASTAPVASASAPKCMAADLGVWVAEDQSEGAAGTIFTPLGFTNLSRHTCTLRGYPGVSAISASGRQLGSPAIWKSSVNPTTVRLASGATAYPLLGYIDAVTDNCPAAQQTTAFELRIYPPDQYGADHTFWSVPTCTAKGMTVFLRVRVIAPGIGLMGSNG